MIVYRCCALALVLAVLTAGCGSPPPSPRIDRTGKGAEAEAAFQPFPDFDAELADDSNFPTYRIMPGDLLEIAFSRAYDATTEDYVLDIFDEVTITTLHHDEVGGTYTVRPDGKITIPYRGSIRVVGLTIDELIARLEAAYEDIFKDPTIFVNLTRFGARAEELRRIVSGESGRQVFSSRVRPDGYASLPIVGDLAVQGLTVDETSRAIEDAYRSVYNGIAVSLNIAEMPGNVFYVLGEVAAPGQYPLTAPTTVTQALAIAGVRTETASLGNVIVVSVEGRDEPAGAVIDVGDRLQDDRPAGMHVLRRHDVVYVPPSTITKANLFMDKYIRKLLLFNGFSYALGSFLNER